MKKRKKYIKETISLVWPYILITIIMLVLFAYGIFSYHRVIAREAAQTASDRVNTLSDEVYTRVTAYRKACDVLAVSSAVLALPQTYGSDANTVQVAINTLKQELSNVVSIASFPYSDVAVYYPKEELIVSIKGVYQGRAKNIERLEAQSKGEVLRKALLEMSPDNGWKICYNDGKAWLIRQLADRGNTAYIIMEFELSQLVPIAEKEGLVIIGDSDTPLYASDQSIEETAVRSIREQVRNFHRFGYKGEEHIAYRCIFSILQTEIMIAVSIDEIIASTSSFVKLPLLLGAICAVCLAIIYRMMYERVILPYRYLAEMTWVDSDTDTSQDVFTLARSNLLSLKSQKEAAEEEKKLLIHLGVGDLLQQVRTIPEDPGLSTANRCLSLAGILPGQRYMVFAAFHMDPQGQALEETQDVRAEITSLSALEEVLQELLFVGRVGVVSTLERYYVVVATCQESDTEEKLNGITNRLLDFYSEHYRTTMAATKPLIGDGPENLRKLIRKTMNDVNYLYFWQKNRIENEPAEEAEGLISFFKAMRNLVNRLDNQDYPGAKAMFGQIMEDNLPRTTQGFQITKYRIYGMIEMLVAAISEQTALGEDTLKKLDYEKRLYETDTLLSFRRTTEQIFMELIDIRQQCDSSEGIQKKIENIKAYIDSHFTENGLTATSVAEYFNLSSSYVSREFKRIVGCNMLEYIQRLRVEQVKKLLADYSVKDAAQKAGFWDSQGLVRVFKKYEGITPGEYKKMLQ